MDRLTKKKRSWNMSRIRSRNTTPERTVRSILHRLGYRFRLQSQVLPGRPDVVLTRYKTVVFVHGCFWHRHPGCSFAYTPKSRKEFWARKFSSNIARDLRVIRTLQTLGWRVLVVWECELRDMLAVSRRLERQLRHYS